MKKLTNISILGLLTAMMFLSGCVNKELCYDHNHGMRVRLAFRWSIGAGLAVSAPEHIKMVLYPSDNTQPYDRHLNSSQDFVYAPEGDYDILFYNWRISADAQTVQFRAEESYHAAEAFTGNFSRSALFSRSTEVPVMLGPDSLWLWSTGDEQLEVSKKRLESLIGTEVVEWDESTNTYLLKMVVEPDMVTLYYTFRVALTGAVTAIRGCFGLQGLRKALLGRTGHRLLHFVRRCLRFGLRGVCGRFLDIRFFTNRAEDCHLCHRAARRHHSDRHARHWPSALGRRPTDCAANRNTLLKTD